VAALPNATLTALFQLQQAIAIEIDRAAAVEWRILEDFGETQTTLPELDELQAIRDRLIDSFSRSNALLLRVMEAQPAATPVMLELLEQAIARGEATRDACRASTNEIEQNWS